MKDLIAQIADRYPEAAREIVETSTHIRSSMNADGVVSKDQQIAIKDMAQKLSSTIAAGEVPDETDRKRRNIFKRMERAIASYAYAFVFDLPQSCESVLYGPQRKIERRAMAVA